MKKFCTLMLVCCLMGGLLSCFAEETMPDFSCIRLNEIMASNKRSLKTEDGKSPDWIEIYNNSDEDVNLKGLCLSDGKKTLDKFVFPDWIIPARGYVIIFASDEEKITETELFTSFKLSADGEKVVLSFDGKILDIINFDKQEKDIAYARFDDTIWKKTDIVTPGAENQFPEME